MIVGTLIVVRLSFSGAYLLEQVSSPMGRVALVGCVFAAAGFVMGFAFPLGVRKVAPTGEWAIQKMWAINGAASIAASVLAAVIGLVWGSGAVVTSGILAYILALGAAVFGGATAAQGQS
jgi:hypothetical protein